MRPLETLAAACEDYYLVEWVLRLADDMGHGRPDIPAIAAAVNLDQSRLDRLFIRWAGVGIKKFLDQISPEHTRKALKAASPRPVTPAVILPKQSLRPGEISFGFQPTPFGRALVAAHDLGICDLIFIRPGEEEQGLDQIREEWPDSDLVEDHQLSRQCVTDIFIHPNRPKRLSPKGSRFQLEVWLTLLGVPQGRLVSYQEIARRMGRAEATRAVAGAIAKNPLAFLIPCHRVIKKNGEIHRYRWGTVRKKAMIGWEAANRAL